MLTEAQLNALAPNPPAVSNAKQLVTKGKVSRLLVSADNQVYFANCTGSSGIYTPSIDFVDPNNPVLIAKISYITSWTQLQLYAQTRNR